MESIDKLREFALNGNGVVSYDGLDEIADEIEREIAEHYLLLPVDAEGVPVKLGDKVTLTDKPHRRVFIVSAVGATKSGNPVFHGYEENSDHLERHRIGINTRHVKPRTIEDVLRELVDDALGGTGRDPLLKDWSALVRKYADELRSMGVGE